MNHEYNAANPQNFDQVLRESEEKYRLVVENANVGILVAQEGMLKFVNSTMLEISQYTEKEMLSTPFAEFVHPDDRKMVWERHLQPVRQEIKSSDTYRCRCIRKNGDTRLLEISGAPTTWDGKPATINFISDLTDRDRAEKKLQESQRALNTLMNNLPGMAYRCLNDRNWTMEFVSRGCEDLTGVRPEDLTGNAKVSYASLIHPDDREQVWSDVQNALRKNKPFQCIYRIRTAGGIEKWVWEQGIGVMSESGSVTALEGFIIDITERKRMESALKESEEKFRSLADSLPQTVFELDASWNFTYLNGNGLKILGYAPGDIQAGLNVLDIVALQERDQLREHLESRIKGVRKKNPEYTAVRKDGVGFPAVIHAAPVMRNNKPEGMRGLLLDMTERKYFEAEFLKSQKLESLGVLAGGIAHDFNNMLTALVGNIYLSRMQVDPGDGVAKRLEEAEKVALQARELTQQLLTFSRGGSPVKQRVSLENVIRHSVGFALSGSAIKCDIAFPYDLWNAEVDEGQVGQVFNNIIMNARQAMVGGGTIRIQGANALLTAKDGIPLTEGRYVKITIADEGTGILPEHLEKIFDPYFTTKKKGTGLGLSVTYSIIRKHEGHIQVESKPGKGTTFNLYFPASAAQQDALNQKREEAVRADRGKVLLMDDEKMILDVTGEILKNLGYEIECADEGGRAIDLFVKAREKEQPFDAVIMDLTVPGGMGGKEAVQKLLAIDPGVKVIVSSGYSNDPVMANFRQYGFRETIVKPYRIDDLSRKLTTILAGA